MKKIALIAATFLVMASAQAAQTNNGCQGNCPTEGGATTNQGGAGGTAYGGAGGIGFGGTGVGIGGAGGAGGQGGAGGSGGSAVAVGGSGGNVLGSGNSNSRNDLSQNQAQGQSQSSRNDNQSSAANTNSNSNAGNNSSQAVQTGAVTYQSSYRAATSSAYAPPIAPTSMCMGSSSAGGTGMTFGFSIGTSWTDSNCQLLEQVRTVAVALNDKETASAMMCSVEAYREARKATGNPCQQL